MGSNPQSTTLKGSMLTDMAIKNWSLDIFLIFHSRDSDYAMKLELWHRTMNWYKNIPSCKFQTYTWQFISLPMSDFVIFDINVQYTDIPSDIQISVVLYVM